MKKILLLLAICASSFHAIAGHDFKSFRGEYEYDQMLSKNTTVFQSDVPLDFVYKVSVGNNQLTLRHKSSNAVLVAIPFSGCKKTDQLVWRNDVSNDVDIIDVCATAVNESSIEATYSLQATKKIFGLLDVRSVFREARENFEDEVEHGTLQVTLSSDRIVLKMTPTSYGLDRTPTNEVASTLVFRKL
jgi:hypothetical protein